MSTGHVVVVNWKDRTHPAAGGAEVYCEAIAKELVELGFRVTYLTSRPKGESRRATVDGYAVRRFGGTYTVYLYALIWLLRHRKDVDAVVDSQNGIPFFTPLVLRRSTAIVMLIHHVHQEQFAMYFSPGMARVGRWLEKSGSKLVYRDRAVAAVSPSSRAEIRRMLGLEGAIHVIPNGTFGLPPRPAARRAESPTITCVGRMVPHKRWHLLVEAAGEMRGELPGLTVNLVGAGPELDALRALVAARGLQDTVVLHGFVSAQERDRLLAEAWLTVSTSVGEGWGLSIVEAAAQGVPGVALDVPGLRDSVRDGITGWLTTEENFRNTVVAAIETLADPTRAAEYGHRCREWADSLRWSASAERFHAVFAEEALRLSIDKARRRRAIDISTIVTLDRDSARALDVSVMHPADQTTFCHSCIELPTTTGPWKVLLHARDERDALAWLSRAGIDARDHVVKLDVCRPHQLLSWHEGAPAHSFVSTIGGMRCPGAQVHGRSPGRLGGRLR